MAPSTSYLVLPYLHTIKFLDRRYAIDRRFDPNNTSNSTRSDISVEGGPYHDPSPGRDGIYARTIEFGVAVLDIAIKSVYLRWRVCTTESICRPRTRSRSHNVSTDMPPLVGLV